MVHFTLELIFVGYYGAFTLELIQDLFGSASESPPPAPVLPKIEVPS